MRDEHGFTLLELVVVIAITGMLLALTAGALRYFWLVRSIQGAQDQVITQMKEAQQRSSSESAPWVYGVRFHKGTPTWGVVRYHSSANACASVNTMTFDAGVIVADTTDFPDVTVTTACRNAFPNASPDYEVAFFYPRGSATAGSVKLTLPSLGRTRTVNVSAVTGRVSKP